MGMAMTRALVDGGAQVVLTGRDAEKIASARTELGSRAAVVRADVTSMSDIEELAEQVGCRTAAIDALFVNQGYAALEPYDTVTEAVYDRHFDVNTKGAYFSVQRLAPLLRDGGAVVFTSSIADEGGSPGMIAYSASKAAVWSFAQGFAAELLPRGIRVNAVSPGFIATPSMGIDASEEAKADFSRLGDEITPMKRHGKPEEVAAAALFLAFEATYTTAVKLPVDGGLGQGIQ